MLWEKQQTSEFTLLEIISRLSLWHHLEIVPMIIIKKTCTVKSRASLAPSLYNNVADVLSSQELRIIFNGVVYRDSYPLLINNFCWSSDENSWPSPKRVSHILKPTYPWVSINYKWFTIVSHKNTRRMTRLVGFETRIM